MKKLTVLLCTIFALWAGAAAAVLPENGLYYNPSEPGLGYYIEVQGTTLVMVTYAFDEDTGAPLFYLASGDITQAKPGISSAADSLSPRRSPYQYEYPYRFDNKLYRFDFGPCITCAMPDLATADYAVEAGAVHLRMADINRVMATFTMNDGSEKTVELMRQGFGRVGYDLRREDGRLLPDLRGDWVFVDRNAPNAPVLRFSFTEVEEPRYIQGDPPPELYGNVVHVIMKFVDPEADATLWCMREGCALERGEETLFLVKFLDIGMDSLLGYKGDVLFKDDGTAIEYRSGDLVIGKHVINRTPDALPPSEASDEDVH